MRLLNSWQEIWWKNTDESLLVYIANEPSNRNVKKQTICRVWRQGVQSDDLTNHIPYALAQSMNNVNGYN